MSTHIRPGAVAVRVALSLLSAACGDFGPAGPEEFVPVPTTLRLTGPSPLVLVVPAAADLQATVTDQAGQPMSGEAVSFVSRDTTTATVSTAGRVTAVASGEVWVVASSGSLRDSVRVETRYYVLDGAAIGRIRGTRDVVQDWEAYGIDLEHTRTRDRDLVIIAMDNHGWPDTTMMLLLPDVAAGRRELETVSAQAYMDAETIYDVPMGGAYLILEGGSRTASRIYTSVQGSHFDVETLTAAGGWGLSGVYRGRMVFRGVGSELIPGATGGAPALRPVGDTISVVVDFAVEYLHWAVGQAKVTIEGGPKPTVAEGLETWWVDYGTYGSNGSAGELQVEEGTPAVTAWMPWPEVGTFPVDSLGGYDYSISGRRVVQAVGPWPYTATGTGGTFTFTKVVPADGDRCGLVAGTATVRLAYWSQSSYPATFVGTATLTLDFDAVVTPGNGPGAVDMRPGDGESLWAPLLRHVRRATGALHPSASP